MKEPIESPPKKKKKEEEVLEVEEKKVLSLKRVGIALVLLMIVVIGALWSISKGVAFVTTQAEELQHTQTADHVKLPTEEDVTSWVSETQGQVMGIQWQEHIASTSAVKKHIDSVLELQSKDIGIEDIFCMVFCNDRK